MRNYKKKNKIKKTKWAGENNMLNWFIKRFLRTHLHVKKDCMHDQTTKNNSINYVETIYCLLSECALKLFEKHLNKGSFRT